MKFRSKHGVFFWYLLMFLVVLLIPLGITSITVWNSVYNTLRTEFLSAELGAVRQAANTLEQYTAGMETMIRQLVQDHDVRMMTASLDKIDAVLEKVQGVGKLNAACVPDSFIGRIIIINRGFTVSNEGLMLNREADAVNRLLSGYKAGTSMYQSVSLPGKIYFISKFSIVANNGSYIICEIPWNNFLRLFMALPHMESNQIAIMEGTGNLVFSSAGGTGSFFDSYSQGDAFQWQKVKLGEKSCFQYLYRINRLNLGLMIRFPEEIITNSLDRTLFFLLFYIMPSVTLGVGLSFWFAYYNYKPVQNILRKIDFYPFPAGKNWSGPKTIGSIYEKIVQDNLSLRNEMQKQMVYTIRNFMTDLLRNTYKENNIEARAKEFNIILRYPFLRVVLIQIFTGSGGLWEPAKDAAEKIQDAVNQAFSGIVLYTLPAVEPNWTAVVLNYSRDALPGASLETMSTYIISSLNSRFHTVTVLGVSDEVTELRGLGKAYQQAVSACEYRLIKGYNKVIMASGIDGLTEDMGLQYVRAFKNQAELEKHLEDGNFGAIEHHINRLFTDIKNSNMPLSLARCIYYEIINLVIRILPYVSVKKLDIHKLMQAGTMELLQVNVLGIFRQVCDEKNSQKEKFDPLEITVKYIHEHYTQPDLSLETAAVKLGYSRTYLSRIFSARMHQPFNVYVNSIRINHACNLLAGRDITVSQAAKNAGYWDLHTFLRNFKKAVGTTPTDYRKSLDEKEKARHAGHTDAESATPPGSRTSSPAG